MENKEQTITFVIEKKDLDEFKRLDAFLAHHLKDMSRSLIKKIFQQDSVKASNETKLELKKMPPEGTKIYFNMPEAKSSEIKAQKIDLDILFEDDHLLIVNKPAGLVVHPAAGNPDGTLVNAVMYHCPDLKGIGNEKRPGIVHRLDKGTSGVMVVAKSQKTHEALVQMFSQHDITRRYEAIVLGTRLEPQKRFESIIGRSPHNRLKMASGVKHGKNAITHMKVLTFFKHFSHVELTLETGRTHQIRVHLSQIANTPIINDPLYGRLKEEQLNHTSQMKPLLKDYDHPLLHAKVLGFIHPITKEELYFETAPPKIFQETLKILEEEDV